MQSKRFIVGLGDVSLSDLNTVGGKNASLGEMIQNLSPIGIKIPGGFILTVDAYAAFIEHNMLDASIKEIVGQMEFSNLESLRRTGLKVRQLIKNGKFPPDLESDVISRYNSLSKEYDQDMTDVAVRSSATAEDLPDASFAGQQETYLNVRGPESLLAAVRNCFASLFTDRAISYRQSFGYDHFQVGLSVGIQKMVRSDLGASGVAFSIDTESGFKDVVVINASFGLGELIVQGAVSPDEYIVFKPTLKTGFTPIVEKKMGIKDKKMVYGDNPDERVMIIPVEKQFQNRFCLTDERIIQLSKWVVQIEEYYTKLKGHWCPMDVEWAIDGISKELFVVQARPETIHSQKETDKIVEYQIDDNERHKKLILKGIAVGDKMGSGKVRILFSLDNRVTEMQEFEAGDVLVTDMTDPDWEPIMKKASAIVTNKGGRTCHAAIVARELGVPAIVGSKNATDVLSDGQIITVSCGEGDVGLVYEGAIPFKRIETSMKDLPKVKTPIMLNVASPDLAFKYAHLPNSGVGLAREEFIINNYIKVHPMALLRHKTLNDPELTKKITEIIRGYENEETFFVEQLSYGIAKIAAAFYPNKVIVRFSDFKTNEYKNMLGGHYFEPDEENPMIGWRGASRYYNKDYKEAYGLECKAIKLVRDKMGLSNVVVMLPFTRTVEECLKVQEVMAEYGLKRGENGLELYLMAEVPSNVILANEFAKHIDGFSIGSNDLTQLTLGLDRDSSLVAYLYDERNPAVKEMIRMLIKAAKANNVKVGICGQGPSDFPDFAQFLVEEGIDSISVTPDSVFKTLKAIHAVENAAKIKIRVLSTPLN